MSVAAYPKYESYRSGVSRRLSFPIPSHWSSDKARFLFKFNKGLTITKEDLEDEGVPCVNYGEIHSKFGFAVDPDRHELKCVSPDYLRGNANSLLKRGDFVFADTSEDIEGSGNFTHLDSDKPTFAGYHTVIARPEPRAHPKYLAYMMDSAAFRRQVQREVKGVKVFSISQGMLKNLEVLLPPHPEQRGIAEFLDGKCNKIDDAVRIKEGQIVLLRERKQIIIQEAVTKGLNPAAPMKDSGIDWIGQIPSHWEVQRNANIFRESKRSGSPDLPVLSVSIHSGVSTTELTDEENIRSVIKIEDRSSYKEVLPGYVAYNMMRAWQGGIGAVRVHGMVSPAYVVAMPLRRINSDYFEYLYRTPAFIWQMDCFSKGIADFRKRLYWDDFRCLVTILPPIEEQEEIVSNIERHLKSIDDAIEIKERQIEALKEFKASIIDAAVTGKIKVI